MATEKKIAVAGATGRLSRHTVEVLRERGHEVVPIARGEGVDVITGEGLAAALEGVDLIVDAATGPSPDQAEATEFFTTSARNLQQAGTESGVEGILVVSIIGTDHFNTGYNAEFVAELVEWGTKGDTAYLPQMRTQLIAARSVAEALADLVDGADSAPLGNPIAEVAGPPGPLAKLAGPTFEEWLNG